MPPLIAALRPPFLLLTLVCVMLGAALSNATFPLDRFAVVLAGALAAHAAVNLLNEWHDFRSGLDLGTQRTPFSGGSGALPQQPAAERAVLALGIVLLLATAAIGLWLLPRSPGLWVPGLAGLLLVLAYTPWVTRHPWICLFAPGFGFGPVMVGGTAVALGSEVNATLLLGSIQPMALVSGLLLLNQFPDVEADRAVGRRHLPMLRGRRWAARLLAGLFIGAYAAPALGVAFGTLPLGALLCLLTTPLAVAVARGALHHANDIPALLPTMGRNVVLTLSAPLLMAIGLWWMPA